MVAKSTMKWLMVENLLALPMSPSQASSTADRLLRDGFSAAMFQRSGPSYGAFDFRGKIDALAEYFADCPGSRARLIDCAARAPQTLLCQAPSAIMSHNRRVVDALAHKGLGKAAFLDAQLRSPSLLERPPKRIIAAARYLCRMYESGLFAESGRGMFADILAVPAVLFCGLRNQRLHHWHVLDSGLKGKLPCSAAMRVNTAEIQAQYAEAFPLNRRADARARQ
ncbi:hypothetical protein FACS1894186_0850 [Alphaproteobacteria bacterium]|nr:hypothetical protein FACS1894186_0850 [Alphaproteobacteria bacterium]